MESNGIGFCSWLFIGVCAAGLLWQLSLVTDEYFKYKVTTSTIVFTPDMIEPMAMTVCFNLFGVLDFKRLKQDLNISVELDENNGNPIETKLVDDLTVKQLFDYTPSNNSIIMRMTYKPKDQSRAVVVPIENLNILKFFRHVNLCYKIEVKNNNDSLSYRENSISNEYQFRIAQIYLNKFVDNALTISTIISHNNIPYQELISTKFIPRRLFISKGLKMASSNLYSSDHMMLKRKSLPPPYETRCTPYKKQGFHSRDHCINDCTASQVWKSFGKVSLMSVVTEPSNAFQVNRASLADKQSYLNFSKIFNNCEWNDCKNDNCHERRIFTTTHEISEDGSRRMRWEHRVSFSSLSFKINSRASLSFVEFLIFVLGSISTWTGLSVVGCNPVKLVRVVYKKIKTTSSTSRTENNFKMTTSAKQYRIQRIMEHHRTRERISQIEENVNSLRQRSKERVYDYLKSKESRINQLEERLSQMEQRIIENEYR